MPVVVVTSVGAKSGKVRKNPVMRVEHDGRYALVASKGGAPAHPTWYHNLVAHPTVELQDGADRRDYTVRVVEGDERATWWERAVDVWPDYAELPDEDRPRDPGLRRRAGLTRQRSEAGNPAVARCLRTARLPAYGGRLQRRGSRRSRSRSATGTPRLA